jgi:hypothetical protein
MGGTLWYSWLGHYVTSRKVTGSIPAEVIKFLNWTNPSGHSMALESTETLTEMRTKILPGRSKARLARMADNLTAICESIV